MINYETDPSPFFAANRSFCETIEAQLKSHNYQYSGFCNSYGYEIETAFSRNTFDYELKFLKHQTTRSGALPVDALDFAGLEMKIKGVDPTTEMAFGKNKLKRLALSKELIQHVPSPFYFSAKNTINMQACIQLADLLVESKVDSLKIKNGQVSLDIHSAISDIFEFIARLEDAIKNCA